MVRQLFELDVRGLCLAGLPSNDYLGLMSYTFADLFRGKVQRGACPLEDLGICRSPRHRTYDLGGAGDMSRAD